MDVDYHASTGLRANRVPLNVYRREVVTAGESRDLTLYDHGRVIEVTASITLTIPEGLPLGFHCEVIPTTGTTTVDVSGDTPPTINGAGTPLTRAAASNQIFLIQMLSTADAYLVTGT